MKLDFPFTRVLSPKGRGESAILKIMLSRRLNGSRVLRLPFFFFGLTFLLLSLANASAALEEGPAGEAYEEGVENLRAGRLEEAERNLKDALQLQPVRAEYHFELANVYAAQYDAFLNQGDSAAAGEALRAAGRELEQAVMFQPDYVPAVFNLGVVYKKLGRFEEARDQFKRVLQMEPAQPAGLLQIGATYEEQGFYDDAESTYAEAGRAYPGQPEIAEALRGLDARRQASRDQSAMDLRARASQVQSFLNQAGAGAQPYGGYPGQQAGQGASGIQAGQAVQQMLPYVSSWLGQQFMKMKGSRE